MECFYLGLIVINMAHSADLLFGNGVAALYVILILIPPVLIMFSLAPRVTKVASPPFWLFQHI